MAADDKSAITRATNGCLRFSSRVISEMVLQVLSFMGCKLIWALKWFLLIHEQFFLYSHSSFSDSRILHAMTFRHQFEVTIRIQITSSNQEVKNPDCDFRDLLRFVHAVMSVTRFK